MHRKRVTCELHDSYFRPMMINTCYSEKKKAEVACSVGWLWEEIAWAKRRVHIPAYGCDDDQTCHSKKGGSCMFRWPVMGGDCVGEEACPYLRVGVWWKYKFDDFERKAVKFRSSLKPVPSLPRVRFLGHLLTYTEVSRPHKRTIRIPLLIAPTSHKRPSKKNKYIFLYILRVVVCLAWAKRNTIVHSIEGLIHDSKGVMGGYNTLWMN